MKSSADERLEQLRAYLAEDPNDPFLYFAIAQEHARAGRSAPALEHYHILTLRFPEYVGTYYHLGKLLEREGRREEAIDTYREGIKRAEDARERNAVRELREALQAAIGFDDGYA